MAVLRIGMAQVNLTVGDLKGNQQKILHYVGQAERKGVDILSFPEMAITGYPPEDLLLKPYFIQENYSILKKISRQIGQMVVIVGFVDQGKTLYNAAAVMASGKILGVYRKMILPNYGVFDEKRYFGEGEDPLVFDWKGFCFGVNICEDMWFPNGPCKLQAKNGARLIMNISASPFYAGKWRLRRDILSQRAASNGIFMAYNNLVGGQDELVYDGHGMIVDDRGKVLTRGKIFEEELILHDLNIDQIAKKEMSLPFRRSALREKNEKVLKVVIPLPLGRAKKMALKPNHEKARHFIHPVGEVYQALVLGTKDYVDKNGFLDVVIGLSGGIDSALTAIIAVDALGAKRVHGIFMPSEFTSLKSQQDVISFVDRSGVHLEEISIQKIFQEYLGTLQKVFERVPRDITEENIQARIRGNLLMALSNKFRWLVLTTGNKSEMSVGYSTLYGDMAGGFSVLKDVPKTLVYRLARYRNRTLGRVIPNSTLKKEPSAELRPGQKDTDSLPPYDILDPILKAYVEKDQSLSQIVSMKFKRNQVRKIIRMVDQSEYKRRQGPPGIKITPRALGKDRRMPITNRYDV